MHPNLIHYNRYIDFIYSRRLRKIPENIYTEKHHIIPKSLGGYDEKLNIIELTAREHFIAHLILWKCFGSKMTFAFFKMCNSGNQNGSYKYLSSRQVERLKENYSKVNGLNHKGIKCPEDRKKKISDAQKGRKVADYKKKQISNTVIKIIKNRSDAEWCVIKNKISEGLLKHYNSKKGIQHKKVNSKRMYDESNPSSLQFLSKKYNCSIEEAKKYTPMYGIERSDFVKKRASETHKNKLVSEKTREKMRNNQLLYIYIIDNTKTNEHYEIDNLYQWCKENKISYSIMTRRCIKSYQRTPRKFKEWKIKRILKQ